jgi:predicted RNA binding protein YcfA (HicA-like mRNA interferase family)
VEAWKGDEPMRPKEFIKLIKAHGFKLDHKGTNHNFYTDGKRLVMVERHTTEIHTKTLARMMKDAGLK